MKFLKVYDVTLDMSRRQFNGLLDPEQLPASQLVKLDVRDLDTPLMVGGEFSIVNNREHGILAKVESLVVEGHSITSAFLDVPYNETTWDYIEVLIERKINDLGLMIPHMDEEERE